MAEKPADGQVTVSQEWLDTLYHAYRFLNHLENWGVDNWDGYGYAKEAMRKEEEGEDEDDEET